MADGEDRLNIKIHVGRVVLNTVKEGSGKPYFDAEFEGGQVVYHNADKELLAGIEKFWGQVPVSLSTAIEGGGG